MNTLFGHPLRVEKAHREDVYQDVARIPEFRRKDKNGRLIAEGTLCCFESPSGTAYLFARGLDDEQNIVLLDERIRNLLNVNVGQSIDFNIRPATFWEELRWSWNASHPAYKVASRIAALSLLLGAIGVMLGVLSLVIALLK